MLTATSMQELEPLLLLIKDRREILSKTRLEIQDIDGQIEKESMVAETLQVRLVSEFQPWAKDMQAEGRMMIPDSLCDNCACRTSLTNSWLPRRKWRLRPVRQRTMQQVQR
mmetsp:Transcript_52230/g.102261  ORF Transcript_52230/g.102261 Transcript_52230/m.102261 type:complete len:111 (-) Transcript_52230:1502-1834(-)